MIFLQVIINRQKVKIDLDLSWPANRFDPMGGECRLRFKNDPDVDEYNVIIGNARTKANTIHKSYLIRDLHITREAFVREYRSNLNKNDFIKYFGQKSFERWNKGKISNDTYAKEKGTLKRLKQFAFFVDPQNKNKPIPEEDKDLVAVLPFHELTVDFAGEFDKFLERKYKNEINGRWNRHKHITTYLNLARDIDKIPFNDPYGQFQNKLIDGNWKPLELGQMKKLVEFYIEWRDKPLPVLTKKDTRKGLSVSEVIVLRRFLFSCNCALRISDLQELDQSMFSNGQMSITPKKTERYGTNIDSVPLNDIARMMLDDEIKDNPKQKVFNRYTDQYANRLLKKIAVKADLKVNLHHHVARYTFASIMDQAGANHTGLMTYMGLRKRDTLEKYVKTNRKVIAADIEKMNEMISFKKPV